MMKVRTLRWLAADEAALRELQMIHHKFQENIVVSQSIQPNYFRKIASFSHFNLSLRNSSSFSVTSDVTQPPRQGPRSYNHQNLKKPLFCKFWCWQLPHPISWPKLSHNLQMSMRSINLWGQTICKFTRISRGLVARPVIPASERLGSVDGGKTGKALLQKFWRDGVRATLMKVSGSDGRTQEGHSQTSGWKHGLEGCRTLRPQWSQVRIPVTPTHSDNLGLFLLT